VGPEKASPRPHNIHLTLSLFQLTSFLFLLLILPGLRGQIASSSAIWQSQTHELTNSIVVIRIFSNLSTKRLTTFPGWALLLSPFLCWTLFQNSWRLKKEGGEEKEVGNIDRESENSGPVFIMHKRRNLISVYNKRAAVGMMMAGAAVGVEKVL